MSGVLSSPIAPEIWNPTPWMPIRYSPKSVTCHATPSVMRAPARKYGTTDGTMIERMIVSSLAS